METISYYDLLNMVKNNEYPSVYYNCSNGSKILYVPTFDDVDHSFLCYFLENTKEYNEEYARHYLAENILESEMFENNLEIVEDIPKEDNKIEKLDLQYKDITKGIKFEEQILMYCDNLQYKINEIIEKVNGKDNE